VNRHANIEIGLGWTFGKRSARGRPSGALRNDHGIERHAHWCLGRGGGPCALGVDRRRRTERAGRGGGGFGQVAEARGPAGLGLGDAWWGERLVGLAGRGDARGRAR